jgi:hypothetical protein
MVLGDSVTFGGVQTPHDETYCERLRASLEKKCGSTCEVLNASAGGWGIGNELAYLEKFGTLGSEMIIWQIGSHDLLQEKNTSDAVEGLPGMPFVKPCCATSELVFRYIVPKVLHEPQYKSTEDEETLKSQFDQNMIWTRKGFELIRAQNSKVCILHTPDRADVVRGPDGKLQEKYNLYRARFLKYADEQSVPVLNLTAEWKDRPEIARVFRDSIHFTSDGNRIVADRLESFLMDIYDFATFHRGNTTQD